MREPELVPLGELCWCGQVHDRCAAHKKAGYDFPTKGTPCRRRSKGPVCGQHLTQGLVLIVDEDEDEAPPASLVEAAGRSRLALLRALRDHIAGRIDAGVPARDLASLSKRLLDLAREIESIEEVDEDEGGVGDAARTEDEAWEGESTGEGGDGGAAGDEPWDGD